jgi:hypothetical protein
MTFYCAEKAKGHDCGAKVTLGIPQCHYCYEYQRGYVEPTSPLPCIEFDNCLAMPYDHVMPVMKKALLER